MPRKQTPGTMPGMNTITLGVTLITTGLIGLFAYVDSRVDVGAAAKDRTGQRGKPGGR
ncbi:hypothetical protein [Phreatobacter stygius]|uniref:hypothetical protein n=1 Tax=Phreatobacter stygius TaxID=1940610 RepID=UPI0014770B15|nr:hypothetical protein [Phreatobacter stygius]